MPRVIVRSAAFASMACAASAVLALALSFGGCSSFASEDNDAAAGGDAAPADAPAGEAANADGAREPRNPYGALYPTSHLGVVPRDGTSAGNVMRNLMFTGFADKAVTSSTIQLADVYDPEGRTHDVVILMLQSAWPSDVQKMMAELASKVQIRVAFVPILNDGPEQTKVATLKDLEAWRTQTKVPGWYGLDPQFMQLFNFYPGYTPVVIALDARTMEIIHVVNGYSGHITMDIQAWRAEVQSRKPAY